MECTHDVRGKREGFAEPLPGDPTGLLPALAAEPSVFCLDVFTDMDEI